MWHIISVYRWIDTELRIEIQINTRVESVEFDSKLYLPDAF